MDAPFVSTKAGSSASGFLAEMTSSLPRNDGVRSDRFTPSPCDAQGLLGELLASKIFRQLAALSVLPQASYSRTTRWSA
jgi:hypothetical protein